MYAWRSAAFRLVLHMLRSANACTLQVLQTIVKEHQERRAAITEEVVQSFTGERPMTGLLEKLFPKMQIQAEAKAK